MFLVHHRSLLVFFLVGLDDLVECRRLYFLVLLFEVVVDDLVEFSEGLSEFGVEVVFDAVVSSKFRAC